MNSYILGLLCADGSCRYNTCVLELKDEEIINKISKLLNINYKSRQRIINNKHHTFYRIIVPVKDYKHYLVKNRPNIDELFESLIDKSNFVRGLIDGDGSICVRSDNSCVVGISVNGKCESILKILDSYFKYYNLTPSYYYDKRGAGSWYVSINRKQDLLKLFHLLYDNSDIHLDRKYNVFCKVVSLISND